MKTVNGRMSLCFLGKEVKEFIIFLLIHVEFGS